MRTQIVFLLGLAGSGKDTVGNIFVKKYGFTRIACADLVKERYAKKHGLDVEALHTQGAVKELHRKNIIQYAEECKVHNPYYWLDEALKKFKDEKGNFYDNLKLVITDCRRIEEIEWIYEQRSKGFLPYDITLIHIKRDVVDLDNLTHYTIGYAYGLNRQCPFVDIAINNNCTITELDNKVKLMFEKFSFQTHI